MNSTETGSPKTAPARERGWQPELGQDYLTLMGRARETRQGRAVQAAAAVLEHAGELAGHQPEVIPPTVLEGIRWSVRGVPGTRESFGIPRTGDFPGGQAVPAEYPMGK